MVRVSQGGNPDVGQEWALIWWFDEGGICFTAYMFVGCIQFLVTVEFMAACFFKISKRERERETCNPDTAVLNNVIKHIASPLPNSLG